MTGGPLDTDAAPFAVRRFGGRGWVRDGVRPRGPPVGRAPPPAGPVARVAGAKRIWWQVVQPLVDLGFEVIVPDLRGFGDSEVGPEGCHDLPSFSRDVHSPGLRPDGRDRLPNHGPCLVRDCGHFVPREAPDVLVSGIGSFCASDR